MCFLLISSKFVQYASGAAAVARGAEHAAADGGVDDAAPLPLRLAFEPAFGVAQLSIEVSVLRAATLPLQPAAAATARLVVVVRVVVRAIRRLRPPSRRPLEAFLLLLCSLRQERRPECRPLHLRRRAVVGGAVGVGVGGCVGRPVGAGTGTADGTGVGSGVGNAVGVQRLHEKSQSCAWSHVGQ